MAEQCPLKNEIYWAKGDTYNKIPEFCVEHCRNVWRNAINQETAQNTDTFDNTPADLERHEMHADPETSDESLQRLSASGAYRSIGVLTICPQDGDELFAENWDFRCPYN